MRDVAFDVTKKLTFSHDFTISFYDIRAFEVWPLTITIRVENLDNIQIKFQAFHFRERLARLLGDSFTLFTTPANAAAATVAATITVIVNSLIVGGILIELKFPFTSKDNWSLSKTYQLFQVFFLWKKFNF